jgi:delta14-sterol reductase
MAGLSPKEQPVVTWELLGEAAAIYIGFILILFLGSRFVPGRTRYGVAPVDGEPARYTLNGFRLLALSAAACAILQWSGACSLSGLLDRFWALFMVANLWAFIAAAALYLSGTKRRVASHAELRQSGFRGAFFGVELNPSFAGIDLKFFSYRPSLLGLAILNAAFAVRQYELYETLSTAMLLYQGFTLAYIINYFQFEDGMLRTWDIVSERFGWMLVWGDYVLVPFFYSLPGWYLIHPSTPLSPWAAAGLVVLYVFGFWLFRGANEQKHRFRTDPNLPIWGRQPETVGGRLLISGFWGIGRHLNYTGEILIYVAFASTTGLQSPVPYLLPLWLIALLAHRAWRDEQRCLAKYGSLWELYTRRVRFRMLPFCY